VLAAILSAYTLLNAICLGNLVRLSITILRKVTYFGTVTAAPCDATTSNFTTVVNRGPVLPVGVATEALFLWMAWGTAP
jgi:hypothetical protein